VAISTVKQSWKRIRKWYERNAVSSDYPDFLNWGAGASAEELADAGATLGVNLPKDLCESYKIYNGNNERWLFENRMIMSLSEVKREWQILTELRFDGRTAKPKGPLRRQWWSRKWIPFASNGGGDFFCLDLDPPEAGKLGQVFVFDHEVGPTHVIAASLQSLLSALVDDLEKGIYAFDGEVGSIRRVRK
jgi:cell wall assembly regulator SMI1